MPENRLCEFEPGYLKGADEYPFLKRFEESYQSVAEAYEFLNSNEMLVELPGVAQKSVQTKAWTLFPLYVNCNYDFYLDFLSYKMGVDVRAVQEVLRTNLPGLFKVLDEEVKRSPIINVTFYRMKPGTTLRLHADSGSFQYRAHMGVRVPKGNCGLKVKDSVAKWKEGRFFVFDSTQPHMAWNLTEYDRVVFSIDIFREPLEASKQLHVAEVRRRMETTPLGFEGGGYLDLDDEVMRQHNRIVEVVDF